MHLRLTRMALLTGLSLICLIGALIAAPVMAAQKSVIVFAYNRYGSDDREAIWQRLINAFNEQSERYTIEAIRAVDNDKLRTMIAGGQAPDVVDFDRYQVVEWAHQGLFIPLDPLLNGEIDVAAEFLPGPANESIFQGRTYAVPTDYRYPRAYMESAPFARGRLKRTRWSTIVGRV